MEKLEILDLPLLSENERGSTHTAEKSVGDGFLLAYRKAGSVSGNHWHKGVSKGKNPERILLISGEIELEVKDLESGEAATHQLSAPLEIRIYPLLFHKLQALSDCAFLELNSLEEHSRDTFYPDSNQ